MKKLSTSILIFSIFTVFSCVKSGTKALSKGDFYTATLQSIEKLTKDPKNEKAKNVLPEAYVAAKEDLILSISNFNNSNQQFKHEQILADYNKLNKLHDLISKCNGCNRLLSPQSFYNEAEKEKELAVNERYALGRSFLSQNNMDGGRQALTHFEAINTFAPNFGDVSDKMEQALNLGSYHVLVEKPKINSQIYRYSYEYFQSRIDEFLTTNKRMNKFIHFYSNPNENTVNLMPADHIVRMELMEFVVGETHVTSEKTTVTSKDSVKTGSAKINGKTVDVFGKVTAQLTKNHKMVRSRGVMNVQIYDTKSNRNIFNENMPGEFVWANDWANYNGDSRALTNEQERLTKNKEELPPAPQQLFAEFCKPIYNDFTSRITRFYKKY